MRKVLIVLMVISLTTLVLTGCAGVRAPVSNGLYTNVQGPVAATVADTYSKSGRSSCVAILGIVSTGDASIEAAMQNGGITKIHHVDHQSMNILGVYAKFTTIVYGE